MRASTTSPRRLARAASLAFWTCACGQADPATPSPAPPPVATTPAPPTAASDALPAPAPPAKVRGVKLLAEATSPFSRIRVRQQGTRRSLAFVRERGDEMVQTLMDLADPDTPTLAYTRGMAAPLLVVEAPQRMLLIGLGGGTMVRYLRARAPQVELDVVEIDPEVVRLAAEWFGVVAGPRLHIHTDDGARFITETPDRYDIVWLDAFLDPGRDDTDVAGVPTELRARPLLEAARARLRPGGVAAFNIHHVFGHHEHIDAIAAVFPRVYVATPRDSNERIVLALEGDVPLDLDAVRARAAALDAAGTWGVPLAELAATLTPWTPQAPADPLGAPAAPQAPHDVR